MKKVIYLLGIMLFMVGAAKAQAEGIGEQGHHQGSEEDAVFDQGARGIPAQTEGRQAHHR